MAKSDAERTDDARIMKLFRRRCVVCMRPAQAVHELVTRARSKSAITMKANRVPLCSHDHDKAHRDGYTEEKEQSLRELAIIRLTAFGALLEEW